MALVDLIEESVVKLPLVATDKKSAIAELLKTLQAAGKIIDFDTALEAVLDRESKGSTGLEDGIAIPHGKTVAARSLTIAIGVSKDGIEFESMDGNPAKLIFLILAPPDKSGQHIEALAEIGRMSKSKAFCTSLVNANSAKDFVSLLCDK